MRSLLDEPRFAVLRDGGLHVRMHPMIVRRGSRMRLFATTKTTAQAVSHPFGYALTVGVVMGAVVGLAGALQSGDLLLAVVVGFVVALVVFVWAFRSGGWGARWYTRTRF